MLAVFLVMTGADSGPGSLREAIFEANLTGDFDQIQFDPSVGSVDLSDPLPDIITNMSIDGDPTLVGALPTITNGSGTPFRIFTAPFNGITVEISNLSISGGSAFDGGAIWSFAQLTVTNCTFSGNTATNFGGAIYQAEAPLTVTGCIFSTNSAGSNGGAIYFQTSGVQPLTVNDSILVSNGAGNNGGAVYYWGSGIVTFTGDASGALHVIDSNTAGGSGGGIYIEECSQLLVSGYGFHGNNAVSGTGGAIRASVIENTAIGIDLFNDMTGNFAPDIFSQGVHLITSGTWSIGNPFGFGMNDTIRVEDPP